MENDCDLPASDNFYPHVTHWQPRFSFLSFHEKNGAENF